MCRPCRSTTHSSLSNRWSRLCWRKRRCVIATTRARRKSRCVADGEKLRQIVLNVLSNAIKFTDAGGAIVISSVVEREFACVRVADTGRGIPNDKIERIFEPFVQVSAGRTRTHSGTGLGLSISRDLARTMGGDLVAKSVVDHGSVFTLRLPLHP